MASSPNLQSRIAKGGAICALVALFSVALCRPAVADSPDAAKQAMAASILAKSELDAGHFAKAAELYHQAFKVFPGEPGYLFSAARAEDKGEVLPAAERDYQEFLKIASPKHEKYEAAQNYLISVRGRIAQGLRQQMDEMKAKQAAKDAATLVAAMPTTAEPKASIVQVAPSAIAQVPAPAAWNGRPAMRPSALARPASDSARFCLPRATAWASAQSTRQRPVRRKKSTAKLLRSRRLQPMARSWLALPLWSSAARRRPLVAGCGGARPRPLRWCPMAKGRWLRCRCTGTRLSIIFI